MKNQKTTLSTSSQTFFQQSLIVLFHFLLFFVPLFFTFNTSELFEFNKMLSTYAITVLILGAWVCRMLVTSRFIFRRTYLDIPILIFLLSQVLSVIFSIHPYTSILGYYSRFHGGLLSTITYIALYYAFVSNVEKKHLPALFLTAMSSGILVSIYGALEHFGHSFSCLMVEGSFGVDCWIQKVQDRVFATFGQPNWLAAYLITLFPISVVLALNLKKPSWKVWFYSGASWLFFLVLLYTQSRSGMLGFVAGGVVLTALISWKVWLSKSTQTFPAPRWLPIAMVGTGLLLIALLAGTPYTPKLSTLFAPPSPNTNADSVQTSPAPVVNRLDIGGTDSGEIRKIVWEGAIKVWQRYPIFGSGVETFAYSYYLDRPAAHNLVSEWDFLYNKAHNEFLNYLATTGLVGLLSYLLLLGWAMWFAVKLVLARTSTRTTVYVSAGVVSGVVALSVSNFFGFSTVMVSVLMFLYFAILAVLAQENTEKYHDTRPSTTTTYLSLASVGLGMLFLLRMIFQYWSADIAYTQGKALLEAGYFDQGVLALQSAIKKNSQEAMFYDELAGQYANYAIVFAQANEMDKASALVEAAQTTSDAVLKLNPRQLNFYKTRARVYITLSQLDTSFLSQAKESLMKAHELAPTDAKLLYNLALVELSMEETDTGLLHLQEAIALKPNYEGARWQLAVALEGLGRKDQALEQLNYIVENISPDHQAALTKIASLSAQKDKK